MYIRRDPIEVNGKQNYKTEPRLVTRMGTAGETVSRWRSAPPGEVDPVGGHNGDGFAFARPARFSQKATVAYPVTVERYATMNDLTQDAYVTAPQHPGYAAQISGTTYFKPRCPPEKTEFAAIV